MSWCAEPGPALRHLHAHGKQALWPAGQRETPVEDRAEACGKEDHFCGVIHCPHDPLLLRALGKGRLCPGYNSKS